MSAQMLNDHGLKKGQLASPAGLTSDLAAISQPEGIRSHSHHYQFPNHVFGRSVVEYVFCLG